MKEYAFPIHVINDFFLLFPRFIKNWTFNLFFKHLFAIHARHDWVFFQFKTILHLPTYLPGKLKWIIEGKNKWWENEFMNFMNNLCQSEMRVNETLISWEIATWLVWCEIYIKILWDNHQVLLSNFIPCWSMTSSMIKWFYLGGTCLNFKWIVSKSSS